MFRVSAILIVILLLFSTIPVSFAQQPAVKAQAEADASADISNKSKTEWFLLGGLGGTLGCFLGCAGGFLCAPDVPRNLGDDFIATSTVLLGACAVPIAAFIYPRNVIPPPERLLGKSPEYIEVYTQAYTSRTVLLRRVFVTAGSIAGNLGFTALIATLWLSQPHP